MGFEFPLLQMKLLTNFRRKKKKNQKRKKKNKESLYPFIRMSLATSYCCTGLVAAQGYQGLCALKYGNMFSKQPLQRDAHFTANFSSITVKKRF